MLFEAASLAGAGVKHGHLPLLGLEEALVHLEQVAGKDCCLVATGGGADLDNGVLLIVGVAGDEHELDVLLQLGQLGLDGGDLLLGELLHVASESISLAASKSSMAADVLGRLLRRADLGRRTPWPGGCTPSDRRALPDRPSWPAARHRPR